MIKKVFHRALWRLGYEVRNLAIPTDAFLEQARLVQGSGTLTIFDAGAHYGESAHQYATLLPGASIYCFEPFPESFAKLQRAIATFPKVQTFNIALSDRAGESEFNSNNYTATNSLLTTSPNAEFAWPGGLHDTKKQIRVQTTTLDRFCQDHSIEGIDILKLDVQGAEAMVLKGGDGLLRRGKVGMVYTEILTVPMYDGQMELHEFFRMMHNYGFELFNVYNLSTAESGQLRQLDAIFRAAKPAG
jgi:FkbM family methyltransferase